MDFKVGDKVIVGYFFNREFGKITGISDEGNLMIRFIESGYSKWFDPINVRKLSEYLQDIKAHNLKDYNAEEWAIQAEEHDLDDVYKKLENIQTRLRELEEWTRAEEDRVHKKFDIIQKDLLDYCMRVEQYRYARR